MTTARSKVVYSFTGEAKDQETIVRQRPMYEDYVRERNNVNFSSSKIFWNMNKVGNFNFKMEFYE